MSHLTLRSALQPNLFPRVHSPSLTQLAVVHTVMRYPLAADVPDFEGRGETEPVPHFYQNWAEAEYLVTVYQYMRLRGYPAG